MGKAFDKYQKAFGRYKKATLEKVIEALNALEKKLDKYIEIRKKEKGR